MSAVLPCDAVDAHFPSPPAQSGFDNTNVLRNAHLTAGGKTNQIKARKTGTTICGMVFDGGVVLAADTRATGELVVDKNCEKLQRLSPNIYSAGAGTAADCRMLAREVSSQLELLRLNMQQQEPKVITAVTILKRKLFQHQGHLEAALIIGGVNNGRGYLFPIAPHGSSDSTCYCTQGSGMLAAMAVLESRYKDDLTREEAMEICSDAILAGIFNDLGSGSNVDLVVITHQGTQVLRSYKQPNQLAPLKATVRLPSHAFRFPVGTTKFVSETVEVFGTGDAMVVE